MSNFFQLIWEGIQHVVENINNFVKGIGDALGQITNVGQGIFAGLSSVGSFIWKGISDFGDRIRSGLEWLGKKAYEALTIVGDFLRKGLETAYNYIAHGITWLGNQIYTVGNWIYNGIAWFGKQVIKAIEGLMRWVYDRVVDMGKALTSYYNSVVRSLNEWVSSLHLSWRRKLKQLIVTDLTIYFTWKNFESLSSSGRLRDIPLAFVKSLAIPALAGLVAELVDSLVPTPSTSTLKLFPEIPELTLAEAPISIPEVSEKPTPVTPPFPTLPGVYTPVNEVKGTIRGYTEYIYPLKTGRVVSGKLIGRIEYSTQSIGTLKGYTEYTTALGKKETKGTLGGYIEYSMYMSSETIGVIKGYSEYEVIVPEYVKGILGGYTEYHLVIPTKGVLEGYSEYSLGETSGTDPNDPVWAPYGGWSRIWSFTSEEELNSYATSKFYAYVEEGVVKFNPPEDDAGDCVREEIGQRTHRVAICLRVEPKLVSGERNALLVVYLYEAYPTEDRIDNFVLENHPSDSSKLVINEVEFTRPQDGWIVVVCDSREHKVRVYDRNKNLLVEADAYIYSGSNVTVVDVSSPNYVNTCVVDVWLDWVAYLYTAPTQEVVGKIKGYSGYKLPGEIRGYVEYELHEDSGTSPYQDPWYPNKDYYELYMFYKPEELDKLFNVENACTIESNSCVNTDTGDCRRDTLQAPETYAPEYVVLAVKFKQLAPPPEEIQEPISILNICMQKLNYESVGLCFGADFNPSDNKVYVGSYALDYDKWYILRLDARNKLVTIWDTNGRKLAEFNPREVTPTTEGDFHTVYVMRQQGFIKIYIDWIGFVKWE